MPSGCARPLPDEELQRSGRRRSAKDPEDAVSKLSLILLSAPLALFLLLHVAIVPMHVGELGWPDHAQHHVLRSAFLGAILAGLGLWLALGPLRQRQPWALRALCAVGLAAYGGFWLSTALVPYGVRGIDYYGSLGHEAAQTLSFVCGLWLARRSLAQPSSGVGG
jgi:hypothetical protein